MKDKYRLESSRVFTKRLNVLFTFLFTAGAGFMVLSTQANRKINLLPPALYSSGKIFKDLATTCKVNSRQEKATEQQSEANTFIQPDTIKKTYVPEIKWKCKTAAPVIGSPALDNGTIYFGSLDSNFYAVDAESGTKEWVVKTQGEIRSTPCIYQGNIYFVSGDGYLYCLKTNGSTRWKFKTAGERKYALFSFADYFQSSPAGDDGIIYFGAGDQTVYAIDAGTGKPVWQYKTGGIVHTKPCIYGGRVFIGSFDGWFYALDKTNGRLVWKFKSVGQRYFPKGEFNGSAGAFNGIVYVGSRDYNFYALDTAQAFCYWNQRFQRGWAITTPLISDSILYLGTSDDHLFLALQPGNGNTIWKFDAGYNIFGAPAVKDSFVYVGTMMGHLYGLHKRTGALLSDFTTDGYKTNHLKYFRADDTYREDIHTIIKKNEDFLDLYVAMGGIISQPVIYKNTIICTSMDGMMYSVTLPR